MSIQLQIKYVLAISLSPMLACEEIPNAGTDNKVVIAWNNIAYNIANSHDGFYSFTGVRALTLVHLSMHNALNAIDPEFECYSFEVQVRDADPTAASSQAAYEILLEIYPERKDTLVQELNRWLGTIKDGEAKTRGIKLGKKSASSLLALRAHDGHKANGNYLPVDKPGAYQYTPGFDWVWIPDLSLNKPFALTSPAQFRSPPPPALASQTYANAFNEVKAYGCSGSEARNEDQTNYAHWWAEFGEHGWNRIARITAEHYNLPLRETARMFALINMCLYDMYLASFDSKYYYNTWRPYTAIRAGDFDGNPATAGDPDWMPEMVTPPWPEYPSAHAAVGAGGAEIVSDVYGTAAVSFTMESVTALPVSKTRTFHSLDSAAGECAESRIMNGFHFRFATDAGQMQGREIAKHIIQNFLRPR